MPGYGLPRHNLPCHARLVSALTRGVRRRNRNHHADRAADHRRFRQPGRADPPCLPRGARPESRSGKERMSTTTLDRTMRKGDVAGFGVEPGKPTSLSGVPHDKLLDALSQLAESLLRRTGHMRSFRNPILHRGALLRTQNNFPGAPEHVPNRLRSRSGARPTSSVKPREHQRAQDLGRITPTSASGGPVMSCKIGVAPGNGRPPHLLGCLPLRSGGALAPYHPRKTAKTGIYR